MEEAGVKTMDKLIGREIIIHYDGDSGSPACTGFDFKEERGMKIV